MSKNNDFQNEQQRPGLDEYLAHELTEYYGEDMLNSIGKTAVPKPYRQRKNRLLSALGIVCAVMFLTGAAILSGLIFTSGASFLGSGNLSDSEGALAAYTDTDKNTAANTDSENNLSGQPFINSDSQTDFDDSERTDNNIDTHSHISDGENTEKDNGADTGEKSSDYSLYPDYYDSENFLTSDIDSENNTDTNYSTDTVADTYTESDVNSNSDNTAESENITESVENDTDSGDLRSDYFSLPEYPYEENVSVIDKDENNNSSTNPYDNVTTGRRVCAGVGIALMMLSFVTAFALNKIKRYI